MNAPNQSRPLAEVAQKPHGLGATDVSVDMFSAQGFALAQRIATAFASSNAVPAQFRSTIIKRERRGEDYVDVEVPNPSAVGNGLVALEVAQAVRMSVTAVMQNADVIEGKLRWSGKFVIAAINASGRFHPLRFDIVNKGMIKATYKEKGAYNKQQRRYDMTEHEVEIENLVCVAWTIPRSIALPANVQTLAQARNVQLPIIESAPVSMKMAVEEGWYAKPGSKWQTEMKYLMLQYRAGSFFGNIHAPDIVMGMGHTTEEAVDTIDVTQQPDGSYAVDVESLRRSNISPAAQRAEQAQQTAASTEQPDPASEVHQQGAEHGETTSPDGQSAAPAQTVAKSEPLPEAKIAERLNAASNSDELNAAIALIADVPDPDAEERLTAIAVSLRQKFERTARRARGAAPSVE
ncbi:hypothetical protein [Paraburkholderia tagetis]|uniref:RecT family protein n=1 Tax=Paraburkholderia tagetis TaxID=2913261 RepID=A0A9X1RJ60_9BURK|nr:hypothetical protein [Paraburkholderia tagetis]MCG5072238.1 hypothetical protein [Paraburkholderia tagetis]